MHRDFGPVETSIEVGALKTRGMRDAFQGGPFEQLHQFSLIFRSDGEDVYQDDGLVLPAFHRLNPAARMIRSATWRGLETIERCPASSSIVVACMRFARKRSNAGAIVMSLRDTA